MTTGLSLHAILIPAFDQQLVQIERMIALAETHCRDHDLPPEALIQARLAPDMLPFAYQVKSTAVHSLGAIEGVRQGVFRPDQTTPPDSFDGLRTKIGETRAALAAIDPAEMDGFIGRAMRFEAGEMRLDFAAEDFLLSFSLPNFYFHATTAYDILRAEGLPLGKRDFLGRPRVRA